MCVYIYIYINIYTHIDIYTFIHFSGFGHSLSSTLHTLICNFKNLQNLFQIILNKKFLVPLGPEFQNHNTKQYCPIDLTPS